MSLADIRRDAVLGAVDEYDRIGRHAFLERYGFGPAKTYFLTVDGQHYDSKAIVGAAHGMLDGQRPLRADEFYGGRAVVVALLERLGFEVVEHPDAGQDHLYTGRSDVSYKVFRANPDRYDVDTAVDQIPVDTWNVGNRHVSAGDHVAIFRLAGTQGADRAIIAFGVVLTDPEPMRDIPNDLWTDPGDGATIEPRVRLRYVRSPNGPLLEHANDVVAGLSASRARSGTVFNATPYEWEQLVDLAGLPSTDLSGLRAASEPVPPPITSDTAETPAARQESRSLRLLDDDELEEEQRRNKRVGRHGEGWVVAHEQQRLARLGRNDLAAKVELVAETRGHGLGYDVLSFDEDGTERLIEVKTTTGNRHQPLFASANEVARSHELAPNWILYRVHDFGGVPDVWSSRKPLDTYNLQPTAYRITLAPMR